MKTKRNLLETTLFSLCILCLFSCKQETDFGFRGFMNTATIVGDSVNGYYCYLDGGGLVISYDQRLAGVERGYFSFHYMEEDWKSAGNVTYIDNASVLPYSIYEVIRPISQEEADSEHLADKDNCAVPRLLSLGRGYRGYFDLNTALSVVNLMDREKVPTKMNLLYDPAKQTPDTLLLQLCYQLDVPDQWTKITFDYGSVSCDFSSLATLKQWSDSVTIVVEAGDEMKHLTKISKKDFIKPDIKVK